MKTVDIAMATYNGENFLEEQILSIQKQSYQNWNLYISDDGSNDNTVNLIKELASVDSRIKLINTERQGGVIANFNCALEHTVSEYIALCDQDDIWPENRLELLVAELKKYEEMGNKKEILIFTDLKLIDQDGEKIADSFYETNHLNPQDNLKDYNLLWVSTVYGCTTIMNRKLLDIALPIPNAAQMHDQWLALMAHKNSGLYYFDFKTICYRQHDNNVVGGAVNTPITRLLNFKRNFIRVMKHVKNIKEILRCYGGLYYKDRSFNNYYDFLSFAFKEIFPKIFFGRKKMLSMFIFLGMLTIK